MSTIEDRSTATDAMINRLSRELEERSAFIQGLVAGAQDAERDLTGNEKELIDSAKQRLTEIRSQLSPLEESRNIAIEVRENARRISNELSAARQQGDRGPVEYRSAGSYMIDRWRAGLGEKEAIQRIEVFHRVAAHQTTSDNEGLIPEPIIGPVVNFIDTQRPIVSTLGPRNLPSGSWSRPKVTQHTQVGVQSAEKTELASRKMIVSKVPVEAATYGGYVNVSRQNVDWSTPQVMDLVINDLAGQYALQTEAATGSIIAGTTTPAVDHDGTADGIAEALWSAAATAYQATGGQGRLVLVVSPQKLGSFGPLFAPINPSDAQSPGLLASAFGQGPIGNIGGMSVIMSAGLPAGSSYVMSTAAVEVYEDRVGALQLAEPSVLGVQVAYAGYFSALLLEAGGVVPLDDTTDEWS